MYKNGIWPMCRQHVDGTHFLTRIRGASLIFTCKQCRSFEHERVEPYLWTKLLACDRWNLQGSLYDLKLVSAIFYAIFFFTK